MFRVNVGHQRKTRNEEEGYFVQVDFLPGSDEMWERLTHITLFKSEAAAQRLALRVRNAVYRDGLRALNLRDCWVWEASVSSPYIVFQSKPTAKLSKEAA